MCNEMIKEQLYNEYDKVVQTIATNIIIEKERHGKYIINNFDPEDSSNRLFFNITAVLADLNCEKIYLNMDLLDYLKLRKKLGKKRLNLKWFSSFKKRKIDRSGLELLDTTTLMNFIVYKLNINIDIFKEINDEYYGWVD